jgi:lipopolysaccharide/colanic/teichoic acid biosynthesis glycosyltransferase
VIADPEGFVSEGCTVMEERGTATAELSRTHDSGPRRFYFFCKRIFDVTASGAAMVAFAPLLPVIAILIRLDSRGPVFFTQTRLGRDGAPFTIYKFRTMADHAEEIRNADGSKFVGENDPRLTRVGRFLRDTSLDELPQLWNILIGDMSVVGPRPDTPGGVGLDDEIFRRKRSVKPGLASLASLHGRNSIPWRERAVWELYYVERASFSLDLEILRKTVVLVLRRDGIYTSKQIS